MTHEKVTEVVEQFVSEVAESMHEGGAYRHLLPFEVYVVDRQQLDRLVDEAYERGREA